MLEPFNYLFNVTPMEGKIASWVPYENDSGINSQTMRETRRLGSVDVQSFVTLLQINDTNKQYTVHFINNK